MRKLIFLSFLLMSTFAFAEEQTEWWSASGSHLCKKSGQKNFWCNVSADVFTDCRDGYEQLKHADCCKEDQAKSAGFYLTDCQFVSHVQPPILKPVPVFAFMPNWFDSDDDDDGSSAATPGSFAEVMAEIAEKVLANTPSIDDILQRKPSGRFRATGVHTCWSKEHIGYVCLVTGVDFTDCLEAYNVLKKNDCCPDAYYNGMKVTDGHSTSFSLNMCSSFL